MQTSSSPPDFRRDINGLRAWAVMSVVLYHLGVPGLHGGFVGVDAFFVISGFLMTGILLKGLDAGQVSIGRFLLARARRILPALLLLCLTLLVLGAGVLMPLDYKLLASHSLSTLAFLSNHKYWSEAGYFDASSHEKWLLHSWSLSVEWQFYLLLPCLFWLVWRLGLARRALFALLGVFALASLALSIWLSRQDPTAAYYGLHSRAWELLIGGLLHAWTGPALSHARARLVEAVGFALLLGSVCLLDGRGAWPGLPALLPTLGTAAILLAGRQDSWFTAPAPLQYLGSRSYSIYLWHWPACVLLSYLGLSHQAGPQLAALAGMLLLSELSWRLAERGAGQWLGQASTRGAWSRLALCGVPPVMLALGLWLAQGWPGRFPAAIEAIAATDVRPPAKVRDCHAHEGQQSPLCRHGDGPPIVVVLGDSHASAMVPAVQAALPPGRSLVQMSYSGCPYVQDARFETSWSGPRYDCGGYNRWVRETVRAMPHDVGVILVSRYASRALGPNEYSHEEQVPAIEFPASGPVDPDRLGRYAAQLVKDTCELAADRPVWMVRPVPEIGVHVPKLMSRRLAMGQEAELGLSWPSYLARNGWVWQAQDEARRQCGVRLIDPTALLCNGERCLTSAGGRPLYADDNHLSEAGIARLVPAFREALQPQALAADTSSTSR